MMEPFRRFLNRAVPVKAVLPAYLVLVLFAVVALVVQDSIDDTRDADQLVQIEYLAYLNELRLYEGCMTQYRTRTAVRDVVLFMAELEEENGGPGAALALRSYLNDRYPALRLSDCGAIPQAPLLPVIPLRD